MKKFLKTVRKIFICVAVLFLLYCLSAFFSNVHVSGNGLFFKIGCVVVAAGVWYLGMYILTSLNDLSKRKKEEKNNFIFKFPRTPVPGWGTLDGVLADLVYDYDLSDHEVERIVNSGVHEAVAQYRKKHPLDNPPSGDLFDAVFPYE